MERFRLQARRFIGPLDHPRRNDTELRQSDDCAELEEIAATLADAGYTGWIFDGGHAPGTVNAVWRLIKTVEPTAVTPFRR